MVAVFSVGGECGLLRVKKLFSDKDNLALSKKFRKFVVLSYTIYCIEGVKQFSPQAEPKT